MVGRKKCGGGVAVYVRDCLQAEKVTVRSSLSLQSHVESIWLKIKFDSKKAVLLGYFYRPPSSIHSQVQIDFNDVEEQLQHVITTHPSQRIIVTGDFNADERTNPIAHSRLTELERYGLSCAVREPTFYRGDCRSVLDVFLLSDALYNSHVNPCCTVETCDYSSHHRRVCLETRIPRCKAAAQYRTARNWRVFNTESFLSDIAKVDWSSVLNRRRSCEEQWDAFSSTLTSILDSHAPVRRFRVRNPKSPPITDETIDLMNQRRAAKLNNDRSYHDLNRRVKSAIRNDYRESLAHRIRNSSPSALYRHLKSVIAPKRGKPVEPVKLSPDELNRYFTSIGVDTRDAVAADFRRSGREPLDVRLPRVHTGALTITPVTLVQLKRVLFSLPNKTSQIKGDIPINILKISFNLIGRYLLRIINTSFATECVPKSWKQAIVIPLHKKDDLSVAVNFRPLTLVPVICKIVEKLVHEQLTAYLRDNHIFSEDQHGFMAQHSTCTALLTVTDDILNGMDRAEISLLTLVDLSRCFDVVSHETLLSKLELLQISTGWFRSYLTEHEQRVRVGDKLSESLPIQIGCFQGTCLGPLLYNIASNDLSCHIPSQINGFRITCVRYADDTQLAISGSRSRLAEMEQCLEQVLDIMCTWFLQNGMKINASKTELLMCGDRRQLARIPRPACITFLGERLESTDEVKNLGVIMDKNLTWESHVKHVSNRCFGILVGLANAKHVLPRGVLPRLVDSLVMSHVRYCVQVYGSAGCVTLEKIQRVFNFAAKIISNRRKYDHISDVMIELEWLSSRQFVDYFDLCMIQKLIASGRPAVLSSRYKFNHEVVSRETRQSGLLALDKPRTNHAKRSFVYRSSKLHNNMCSSASDFVVRTASARSFKVAARQVVQQF